MSRTKLTPLYPTYAELCELTLSDYPKLHEFLENIGQPWCSIAWQWGKSFLEYTGRNKSIHTYDRFRNEVEKFLLWAFLEKKKPYL